ncbi:MAG TPA: CHAP domain-containing protein [Acidimicrobiales bacterium]|nr:CHAP domain-containing protein [Acidimicrobiales bacterium]
MRARTAAAPSRLTTQLRGAAVTIVLAMCALFQGAVGLSGTAGASTKPAPAGRPDGNAAKRPALEQSGGFFKDGGVLTYGSAQFFGSPTNAPLAAPIVTMAATPDGKGYWLVGADGGVIAYGDARFFGSTSALKLYSPVVAMAPTPDGGGYWLVSMAGGVYPFGDAAFYGSTAGKHIPEPIVGFAATPDGKGYWMVASHGEVYAFGDAGYYGSLGATHLHNIPIVAIAPSFDGRGYWIVQGGGEVTPYGDAPRLGGLRRGHPPVDGIAVTPDGLGYWLLCGNGEVDAFGDAPSLGGNNKAVPRPPISAIVADPVGGGYWLLDAEAFPARLNHPDAAGHKIVTIAASQLGPSKDGGNYCNPYGPCEEWCSLFATWVWESAGIPIPRYAFVGDVYNWARRHTSVLPATASPVPGDLVLYGTGPQSVAASPHIGVVAQVWPDGAIDTVEGDTGPGPGNWTSVLVNGPYLPAQSFFANGMPIYGFAVP